MDTFWISFWLFCITMGVANVPDQFDPKKNVCLPDSQTLYTNVGTPVLGPDGKPIGCAPK
jgi:hypothetical protein